ncbi:Rdx family protein [Microvirga thermotolerans]|uniref:SelT/SelW/SelH family protein n=1 Tax=Microvirga thermotolerans TaxID=2651334 RepID=A0A5P9JU36_9HYPH|nr:Rdx family protein [Microvirga thermotolerans]QFU14970.1 hypothetical protein GDR74_01365 [Microvirga thermotolerans]
MASVTIRYCRPCGYEKRARAAASALGRRFGLDVDLVPGGGGVFQVLVDGRVATERAKGFFPDEAAIVAAVAAALGKPEPGAS